MCDCFFWNFHDSRSVFMVLKVPGWFLMVPGVFFMVFQGSRSVFHGSRYVFGFSQGSKLFFFFLLVVGFSWLQVGF